MKRIVSFILLFAFLTSIFSVCASAASYAPKPEIKVTYYNGYTLVGITVPDGATVRYTVNGKNPTSSSPKYKSGKLKIKKAATLKLRVSKSGCKTKIYSRKISVKYTDFKAAVNAATLKPVTSGMSVDSYVKKAVQSCTNSKMTTYEKVRACYGWLVKNVKYAPNDSSPIYIDLGSVNMSSFDDLVMVLEAEIAFKNKKGVCDDFASAFVMMCRYIGVNAYLAHGQCRSSAGGYTGHTWVVIKAGGKIYQFDAMLDSSTAQRNGTDSSFLYFAREDGDSLYRNREIVPFNNFE